VAVTVTLAWPDGRTETVECGAGESIVDAAEGAGIGLPYGCLTGACGTCTARLCDGDIDYERPPRALKERHREAGYVLACIARPRTDCRLEVGAHLQAELVENPWK
jgi:ferredoxin